jgi:hypothetical protein
MLSPGNHEAPCDYGEYTSRAAHMPHWGSGSADMQYYSYTVGRVGERHALHSNISIGNLPFCLGNLISTYFVCSGNKLCQMALYRNGLLHNVSGYCTT